MDIDAETTTITDEQAETIQKWLDANRTAKGWLNGYPLGGSYIDTRAAAGSRTDGRKAYVDLDHATARKVPELRGQHAHDIRAYLEARAAFQAPRPF